MFTFLLSCSGVDDVPTIAEDAAFKENVSFYQIFKDYDDNPIRAKEKYNNNIIGVTGEVAMIEQYGSGYKITLKKEGLDRWVVCYFNEDQQAEVKNLTAGDLILVKGNGMDYGAIDYEMNGCRIYDK